MERSSRSLALQVPVILVDGLLALRSVVRIGVALILLQLGIHVFHHLALKYAVKQRFALHEQLQQMDSELDSLKHQLQTTFKKEDLLHLKFGVTPPDKGQKELGTGGPLHPDSVLLWQTHPTRGLKRGVVEKMDRIEAQLIRGQQSYTNLKNFMEQRFTQWRHIPSISPSFGRLSSGFGPRTHPVTGEHNKMHQGIDISNSRWTPIFATADGVVELIKFQDYFGIYVVVNHGNGYVTKYGHLEKPIVKEGQFIQRYQTLGYMGRTGRTTGVHVHYEVLINGEHVNPLSYIMPIDYAVD